MKYLIRTQGIAHQLQVAGIACLSFAVAACSGGGESSVGPTKSSASGKAKEPPELTVAGPAPTAPAVPTVSAPFSSPLYSNSSALTIAGGCDSGNLVTLSGADAQSVTCASSAFSFSLTQVTDGTYVYDVTQTTVEGVTSETAASVTWIRDTVVPAIPAISAPTVSPFTSTGSSITLAGACESNVSIVSLSGASTQTAVCSASQYSFSVSKTSDGTYDFAVVQSDLAGNASQPANFTWVRSTVAPAAPTIVAPVSTPIYSQASSITVSGACAVGGTVALSGADSQTTACTAGGTYSFASNKSTDGTYLYEVTQTGANGLASPTVSTTWIRDTVVPAAPTIVAPAQTPYVSGDASVTITGACETASTVSLSGAASQTATCAASAYSFTVPQATDGTYNFSLIQTDQAGNASAVANFSWVKDTSIPSSPLVALPSQSPHYSSTPTLTLSGACTTGHTVLLSGADTQSVACASSSYSFTVSKSVDGSYGLSLAQISAASISSAATTFTWIRDTVAAAAPVVISPVQNPYYSTGMSVTISGTCESDASVTLSGADTQVTTCSASAFSFTVNKSADGNYDLSIRQTDRAGNASVAATYRWVRDTSVPSAPTLATPGTTPFISNTGSITVAGGCTTGNQVALGGSDSQLMTCVSSAYSFTVSKAADGSYPLTVKQTSLSGVDSSDLGLTWVRDTVAPTDLTIAAPSSNPFLSGDSSLSISGACESGAAVALAGASEQTVFCAGSAYVFTVNMSVDGVYDFTLSQQDPAANSSTPVAFQWTRASVAPATPVIAVPSSSPYRSNGSSLVISGSCANGATVKLSGADTQAVACASSMFSFTVGKSVDGTYAFSVLQTSLSNIDSAAAAQSWVRDSVAPSAPTISAPLANPYTSGDNSITLTGACEDGAQVALTGASIQNLVCASSAYSFSVAKSVDGTYALSLTQSDAAGNVSAATAFQWVRDTAVPSTPLIAMPSLSPFYSNGSTLTVSGSCTTGQTVLLGGGSTQSQVCVASAFSFTVNSAVDGTLGYTVTQRSPTNIDSNSVSISWIRDTVVPSAPVNAGPAPSTYYSSESSISITGSCETGATVSISGASTQASVCTASAYSFSYAQTADGTYDFLLSQTDQAGNSSANSAFRWVRDTSVPATPLIASPAQSPFHSNGSNLLISGVCLSGHSVQLSGATTQSQSCSGSMFSFSVSQSVDGSYLYEVSQASLSGVSSAKTSVTWVRDTMPPSAPLVSVPSQNPYLSADSTITLSGSCETDATVSLSGASIQQTACVASAYSFSVSNSSDGTYDISVGQLDRAGNASSATAFRWVRDTAIPSTPTISSPAQNPSYSSASSLVLAGTCVSGYLVQLSGADTQSVTCSSSAYTFTVNKSSDATYVFSLKQRSSTGILSAAASYTWIRDTLSPAAVTIANPTANPYVSGDSSITISGACETNAAVSLTGASTQNATCAGSAYIFTVSQAVDGIYNYALVQTDRAGNASATAAFEWDRDTTMPGTPTIASPGSTPFYSNQSSLVLAGGCTTGYLINLTGDTILSTNCVGGSYSFTVSGMTDGQRDYAVTQTNPDNDFVSGQASISWIRDTQSPTQVTIANPSTNPYISGGNLTLAGTCEVGAMVQVSGDLSASVNCSAGATYTLVLNASVDATYNLLVAQVDRAGNSSGTQALQWIRNSSTPGAPTIAVPAVSPLISNTSSITISGSCAENYTVTLGGDVVTGDVSEPAGSLTQACNQLSYSFTVSKTIDGIYGFALTQSSADQTSGAANLSWTRDTVGPTVVLASAPPATNLSAASTFTFTSEAGAVFECAMDAAPATTCTSPMVYPALTNGSHTFQVRARDAAGNLDTSGVSYTWTQLTYNTLALYHFDTAAPFADSSSYTGGFNNPLTNSGTTAAATGAFAQARILAGTQSMSGAHTATLAVGTQVMTVEGQVKFTSLPTSYVVLASKTGAAGQLGWEVRFKKTGNKYYLSFVGSLDGTSVTEVTSTRLTASTTAFRHFAVTWNRGRVAFFFNGVAVGAGTIGTAGTSTLFNSNADMAVGRNPTGNYLQGTIDELRISQTLRYSAAYTPPTAAFSAD